MRNLYVHTSPYNSLLKVTFHANSMNVTTWMHITWHFESPKWIAHWGYIGEFPCHSERPNLFDCMSGGFYSYHKPRESFWFSIQHIIDTKALMETLLLLFSTDRCQLKTSSVDQWNVVGSFREFAASLLYHLYFGGFTVAMHLPLNTFT